MPISEVLFGSLLVVGLVVIAFYYGWRQIQMLRRLNQGQFPDEERRLERSRANRRLLSCGLLLVMAVLLAILLSWYEIPAQQLADAREKMDATGAPNWTEEQKSFLRTWGGVVIAILLVLLVVLALAAVDMWETRRYGLAQMRKLQADRRAMIQRQANRLRLERQEMGEGPASPDDQ